MRMQPTDVQVERSLDYLRTTAEIRQNELAAVLDAGRGAELTVADLPPGLVERIEQAPDVRHDRLAEARTRFAAGEQPDADTLAARMVGRLVCDRLR